MNLSQTAEQEFYSFRAHLYPDSSLEIQCNQSYGTELSSLCLKRNIACKLQLASLWYPPSKASAVGGWIKGCVGGEGPSREGKRLVPRCGLLPVVCSSLNLRMARLHRCRLLSDATGLVFLLLSCWYARIDVLVLWWWSTAFCRRAVLLSRAQ